MYLQYDIYYSTTFSVAEKIMPFFFYYKPYSLASPRERAKEKEPRQPRLKFADMRNKLILKATVFLFIILRKSV